MPNGYNGKILRVNLSNGKISVDERDDLYYRTYFGGTALIAEHLLRETKPGIDPLGPDNKLIFAAGPVTGAPLGGAGRNSVGAKSPLTGAFGDSQAGGYFGVELKHAGYDAVIVEGQSDKPVYLSIIDGQAEIKDASHLWGKDTAETEATLRVELGQKLLRSAAIGPAGENLVRVACIMNDVTHAYGRTGMGAVMGSKKLKAIAVRGHGGPAMADPDKVKELAKFMVDNWKSWALGAYDAGTAGGIRGLQLSGGLPTRNFREGAFEGFENLTGERMRDTILTGRGTCYACPIHCKREVTVGAPWNVEPTFGGPEYESIGALGSLCGVDDLGAVAKASALCNAYSLDTIGTGAIIAFAMECFENGILTSADTDGLDLRFGNAQAMVQMVEMIARRQGLGNVLAEGVARASQQIGRGAEQFALHIKGQELPMHEPRYKMGMGMGFAVSPTGADHCHSIHDHLFEKDTTDMVRLRSFGALQTLPADDLSLEKVRICYYDMAWRQTLNCAVTCLIARWSMDKLTEVVNAVTGWNSTFFELFKVGERAATLARVYNLREGFTAADDVLPRRMHTQFESGPLAGVAVDEGKLNTAIVNFYQMMGWDRAGVPTEIKLAELGIAWAGQVAP
ncbi:MAG: aldehyde ferredoxin oxidoreductase family protein [Chloroflexota bacterium]